MQGTIDRRDNEKHHHSGIRYVTPGQRHAGQDRRVLTAASCALPGGARAQPAALDWCDPKLEAGHRRHPQIQRAPRGQHRNSRFPVRSASRLSHPDLAAPRPRRTTQEMGWSGATRSHAQRSEHDEDGEHRTFSAVSTVAHSRQSDMPQLTVPLARNSSVPPAYRAPSQPHPPSHGWQRVPARM